MHDYSPLYSPFAPEFFAAIIPFFILIALWTVIIKGYALWTAARNTQKWWFIALLVINTVGLLEIIYLVWFRSDKDKKSHAHRHVAHPPAHYPSEPEEKPKES